MLENYRITIVEYLYKSKYNDQHVRGKDQMFPYLTI